MAELPTKKELLQLYFEKGQNALIWYAWRNALRIVPALGDNTLQKMPEDLVRNLYTVCRTFLVLAQHPNNPKRVQAISYDIARAADAAASATINLATTFSAVAYDAARAADVVSTSQVAEAAAIGRTKKTARVSDSIIIRAARAAAARADYETLLKQENLDSIFWFSCPLWPTEILQTASEPEEFAEYREYFITELNRIGLDFIAKDMEQLWSMGSGYKEPLGVHAQNYFKNLSDTITSDPVALRESILGGKDAAEKLQTVRILLLGPGGAGKSSLRDRLLGHSLKESINKKSTAGVEYEWLDKSVLRDITPSLSLDSELKLRLWDFGGQTIFYGLHRAFLHENCVYVLVVDSRHEQAPDE